MLISSIIGLIIGIIDKIKFKDTDLIEYIAFFPYLIIVILFNLRYIKNDKLFLYEPYIKDVDKFKDNIFFTVKKYNIYRHCEAKAYTKVFEKYKIYLKTPYNNEKFDKKDLLCIDENYFNSLKSINKFKL